MAEGRGRFDWNRTSSLMALLVNIFRDRKKGKSVKPADFNPYQQHSGREKPKIRISVAEMKQMLTEPERMVTHGRGKR